MFITMRVKTAQEIHGYEYDWLACDENGYIALFSTAGGGYTPKAFLNDTDAYDRAIAGIQELPATTVAVRAPCLRADLHNSWKEMAVRGIFSFDADANGGAYRLVGVPAMPSVVDELPPQVGAVIKRIQLKGLQFAAVTALTEGAIRGSVLG